uniref:Secreted protein n=1 Tax=Setaria viridis TaxID=4556 RepID=A0A4U6SQ19_SETVI|nr:hypothetical protein SEVIR_9G037950v2 [Setaria viridis]
MKTQYYALILFIVRHFSCWTLGSDVQLILKAHVAYIAPHVPCIIQLLFRVKTLLLQSLYVSFGSAHELPCYNLFFLHFSV